MNTADNSFNSVPAMPRTVRRVPEPASPKRRKTRPGWKAALLRQDTFRAVRTLQKSAVENPIDLICLREACRRITLDRAAEEIMGCDVLNTGWKVHSS